MKSCGLLSTTIRQMRTDACLPRHQPAYEAGKSREPSFAPHHALASVLGALHGESDRDGATRDELTRALLREHRAGNGRVWTHALFAAYYPMLSRLRARVMCAWPAADVDQVVLGAFSETLDRVELSDAYPCSLLIRQRTARLVFRRLHRASQEPDFIDGDWADLEESLAVTDHAGGFTSHGRITAEALHAAGDDADLVRATVMGDLSLREYVDRTIDGDEETRRRAYRRLRSQRARALKKLAGLRQRPSHVAA